MKASKSFKEGKQLARLEDLYEGARIKGVDGERAVTIIDIKPHGNSVMEITYKTDSGAIEQTLLYRSDEEQIQLASGEASDSFSANADDVKLASEAYRIKLAHLFDPYLAVRTSSVEPLPHQISAVYEEMLQRMPLRYVLADDPGAGKTIMTGLLIKEMMARGDLHRCLIVCPGNLAEQWQDELFQKFGLRFAILTNEMLESAVSGNAFQDNDLCIARLDKLSRNEDVRAKLENSSWDLIVCDEAHKMSATVFGNETKYTKRYRLGQLLGVITENLLLLTATPHNGKTSDFMLFMALVDPDRFAGIHGLQKPAHSMRLPNDPPPLTVVDVSDVMRRLVKEELLTFEGKPLFPERRAFTVNYSLSVAERSLYDAVTNYVREEFNRADKLDNKRKNSVGFALTTLQRRLASSSEAIFQSLKRRVTRLEERLEELKRVAAGQPVYGGSTAFSFPDDDGFDADDYTAEEYEDMEEDVIDSATAAASIPELEAEISTLKFLRARADAVRKSGEDRKWEELSKLLQNNEAMFGEGGRREKLIVFTEHKDTLYYLADKIRQLLGDASAVITIQGGMSRDDRRAAEETFRQDKGVRILVATDAAGEGINLQRAHLMVNYDLPWNPNRLEQRFGRIHRIGQREVCNLWNLVARETREGEVFERLLAKLEEESAALGGKVFDILGRLTFENQSLRELLLEAIRYGDDPEVRGRLDKVVDNSFDQNKINEILDTYALTEDMMDVATVSKIREEMELLESRKLEPHFIEAFFLAAFERLGGTARQREAGRYEVSGVPMAVRNKAKQMGTFFPVLSRYERICFDKAHVELVGKPYAELVAPGHPLLDAIVEVVLDKHLASLKAGTVYVDENDLSEEPRVLACVESTIQDATTNKQGKRRIISQDARFVEIDGEGRASFAGYAPYLDYRAPHESERDLIEQILESEEWLDGAEDLAYVFAAENIVPGILEQQRARREAHVDKVKKAVDARLTAEIQYWDAKAGELREKEAQGKRNARLNSENATRRADELAERRIHRLAQLELERKVSPKPPNVASLSLVIPKGLIWKMQGNAAPLEALDTRKAIEARGMQAVAAIERELGCEPKDVSANGKPYDIESHIPLNLRGEDGHAYRFIEVKAHSAGSDTVTVSKNEILFALSNKEQHILALVEIEGNITRTTYLTQVFTEQPDFKSTAVVYPVKQLIEGSRVLLEKEETWQ